MSIFDNARTKKHGCSVCGEKTTMMVLVLARQLKDAKPSGRSVSRASNFCAEHGEALYLKLVDELVGTKED